MRTTLIATIVSLLGLVPLGTFGAITAQSAATAPAEILYPATVDNLALDTTLVSSTKVASDALVTLTVKNTGSARDILDINAVHLWVDAGPAGWQGWGTDRQIAAATAVQDQWIFSGLHEPLPSAGLRLFVTVDTRPQVTVQKTVQLVIPARVDEGSLGHYDVGDAGFFLASGTVGPDADIVSSVTQFIRTSTADNFPPDVIVTAPQAEQTLTLTDRQVVIRGAARDQGRSGVVNVQVAVSAVGASSAVFGAAAPVGGSWNEWEYAWQPPEAGQYQVSVRATDAVGNQAAHTNSVTFSVRFVDPTLVRDGMLVRARDGQKVYVVGDGQKHWITSEAVFTGLGYRWSSITVMEPVVVDAVPEGESLTVTWRHPNGTLVKYQTYPEVYRLEGGVRRHIANEITFVSLGYRWSDIITIPDWETYPDGPEVTLANAS